MNLQKTGVFIQNARKRMNLSQRMLGEKLSVTSQAVSKWERGLGCPDIEVLKEMATLFGCSITDILNGEMSTATTRCFMQPDEQPSEESREETESLPERDLDISIDLSSAQLISPLLFGDNLEHTRACIYGGLSAEVLRNRKFAGESGRYGCAQEWYPIGRKTLFSLGTDVGYLSAGKPYTRHAEGYKMHRGLERNAQYITNFAAEKGGFGQKDLYVRGAMPYECTIAVMASVETKLTVSLLAADRTVYDSAIITAPVGDYEEITVSLASQKEDPEARLEITFDTEGTVMIGAVSLLPSDHFHGLRRDVIERMKELGIRLLRWPGGNFAGDYNWKDGLLPRNMRAPFGSHLGLGTQPNSMGFDFHEIGTDEFIALCREIGAEPFITLTDLQDARKKADEMLKRAIEDILADIERSINDKMKEFNDSLFTESRKAPHLHFNEYNSYRFETPDDTGTGSNYKGMVVYDLAVLYLTALPAIAHDSLILKNIGDGAVDGIMKIYAQSRKQVFIAFDKQAAYMPDTQKILADNTVLKLSDGNCELYGESWNKEVSQNEDEL